MKLFEPNLILEIFVPAFYLKSWVSSYSRVLAGFVPF